MFDVQRALPHSLQSHFDVMCLALKEALCDIVPPVLQDIVYLFCGLDRQQFQMQIQHYESAWAFLCSCERLSVNVIRKAHTLLEPNISHTLQRKVTLLCGGQRFPPDPDIVKKVQCALHRYRQRGDISKLVFALLCRWHVFENANGRLARLLISWHYRRPLLFKHNKDAAEKWLDAMTSPRLFRQLVKETAEQSLYPVDLLSWKTTKPVEIENTTTTTEPSSLPDWRYWEAQGYRFS